MPLHRKLRHANHISDPLRDSKLQTIMLNFRPIAPKPATTTLLAANPPATNPMLKRRRARTNPNKITASVKKETAAAKPPPPTASVTVERITAAGLAASDGEEIKRRLEVDESPCFVSDSADCVTWVNAAFRKMVLCEKRSSLRVELVTRVKVPGGEWGWFTCVARVRRGKVTIVAPCDVWGLVEEGKWAWRLDVATALGLGLSCV